MDGTQGPTCGRANASACLFLLLVAMGSHVRADDAPPSPAEPRVARLIRELGAPEYATRERANARLSEFGEETREQLEQALEHEDLEVRLRAGRLLDDLKVDQLWRASRVEFAAEGATASQALAALARQSGNHIHIGDPYGNFADGKLDADVGPMDYWQAVDQICDRAGNRIRPHYDMHTPGIVVSAGAPPRYPRAYGGPVRGEITEARRVFIEELKYEEQRAELTHSFQVNLKFGWEDRFQIVGYASQPELVEAVTDNHVVCSPAQPSGSAWNATTRGLRQVTANLKLNPVPITAKSFAVFTVRWGLIAVGEPAVLEIDDFESKRTFAQDDVAATVVSVERGPAAKISLTLNVTRDLSMPDPREVIFQEYSVDVLDADGRKFRVQSQSPSLSDGGVQLKLTLSGESPDSEPKLIKLHYPRLRSRRNVELTFRDVPLPTGRPE
ncbi:MAG: hypothetical protein WD845_10720 [Pirellulales bacterium]